MRPPGEVARIPPATWGAPQSPRGISHLSFFPLFPTPIHPLLFPPFPRACRRFTFPPVEGMGEVAVEAEDLRHGYGGSALFDGASLTIRKGERVALVGPNGARRPGWAGS